MLEKIAQKYKLNQDLGKFSIPYTDSYGSILRQAPVQRKRSDINSDNSVISNFFKNYVKTFPRYLKDYRNAGILGVADSFSKFQEKYMETFGSLGWKLLASRAHNQAYQSNLLLDPENYDKHYNTYKKNIDHSNRAINKQYYNIGMQRIKDKQAIEKALPYRSLPGFKFLLNNNFGGTDGYRKYTEVTADSMPYLATQTIPGLAKYPILNAVSQFTIEPVIETMATDALEQVGRNATKQMHPKRMWNNSNSSGK